MEYSIDKTKVEMLNQKAKLRSAIIASASGSVGILLALYVFLQSETPDLIIISSILTTVVIFISILYFMILRKGKRFFNENQKIIVDDKGISYNCSGDKKTIGFSQIKRIDVFKNKNGEILSLAILGKRRIIVQRIIEDIPQILNELEEKTNESKIRLRTNSIFIRIFSIIGALLILFIVYFIQYKYTHSIIGILADIIIPVTGGVLLIVAVSRGIFPGKKNYYRILGIVLIAFSLFKAGSEFVELSQNKIEIIEGISVQFPVKPNKEEQIIEEDRMSLSLSSLEPIQFWELNVRILNSKQMINLMIRTTSEEKLDLRVCTNFIESVNAEGNI
ncbi:MAG: hypothetical protein KAR21_18700 [Spirochaetales bacterium]|nr:hypothetical protein [Spirochaetales bacterium]